MSSQSSLLRQAALLAVGTFSVLIGSWILLGFLVDWLELNLGISLSLGILQFLAVLGVLGYATYWAAKNGLLSEIRKWFDEHSGLGNSPAGTVVPITVAKFEYTLDDPTDPEGFNLFLDHPLIQTGGHYLVSPAELAEKSLIGLASELQTKYKSKIVFDTTIKRGSLDVTTVISAVVLAKELYTLAHDIFESTADYRNRLAGLFDTINEEYKASANKTARISGGVQVITKPEPIQSSNGTPMTQLTSGSTAPVTVTNSFSPPQTTKDLNVSVNLSSPRNNASSCINSCLLFLLVLTVTVTSLVLLFIDYDSRLQLLDSIVYEIVELIRAIGANLVSLADNISSY